MEYVRHCWLIHQHDTSISNGIGVIRYIPHVNMLVLTSEPAWFAHAMTRALAPIREDIAKLNETIAKLVTNVDVLSDKVDIRGDKFDILSDKVTE